MRKSNANHNVRPVVLNIGTDRQYLLRRSEILAAAGYHVIDTFLPDRALVLAKGKNVRIAIFGHRISAPDRVRISQLLKSANPALRLVVMYEQSASKTEHADAVLQINVPPADLVHTVEYLLNGKMRQTGTV